MHGTESVSNSALPLVWLSLIAFLWQVWRTMICVKWDYPLFAPNKQCHSLLRTPRSWVRASSCTASTNSKTMASWLPSTRWRSWRVEFVSSNSSTVPCSVGLWQLHTLMVVLRSIVAVKIRVLCRKTSRYSHHRGSNTCFYHGRHTYVVANMLPKRYFILLSFFIKVSKKVSTTCCSYFFTDSCMSSFAKPRLVFHRKRWQLLCSTRIHLWCSIGGSASG